MYWKLSQLLFSCLFVCSTSARSVTYKTVEGDTVTVGSYIREVRTSMPLKVAEEIKDLTSADNTPKSGMAKKRMKNISGMFHICCSICGKIYENIQHWIIILCCLNRLINVYRRASDFVSVGCVLICLVELNKNGQQCGFRQIRWGWLLQNVRGWRGGREGLLEGNLR